MTHIQRTVNGLRRLPFQWPSPQQHTQHNTPNTPNVQWSPLINQDTLVYLPHLLTHSNVGMGIRLDSPSSSHTLYICTCTYSGTSLYPTH